MILSLPFQFRDLLSSPFTFCLVAPAGISSARPDGGGDGGLPVSLLILGEKLRLTPLSGTPAGAFVPGLDRLGTGSPAAQTCVCAPVTRETLSRVLLAECSLFPSWGPALMAGLEYLSGCAEGIGVCELVGSLTEWLAALAFRDELLGKKELAPLAIRGRPGRLCTVHNVLLKALGLGGSEGVWSW